MQNRFRTNIGRSSIICVDSYENGVLRGRLYSPLREMETFSSLSQLLLKMEQFLNLQQMPRAYTETRAFSEGSPQVQPEWNSTPPRRGERATFELQVMFRRHTSWQGVLHWVGKNVQQQFRSVLELVVLLDSALSSWEEEQLMAFPGVIPGEQNRPPAI